ncbi:MAG: enolase C-terminal domain-like protein, partial [Kiloniellales bacterium]|nr:enolase C-terminal domain-like protein [Kiloniellales bacterium]
SLCTLHDAELAIENKLCNLFNIRLSKCGGFINSLRIAQLAERYGMGYQVGCLVGETALLSAAGRQMATLLPSLRYLEGSYDRHLLTDNVTTQDITFSYAGKAPALNGKGLGLMVDSLEQNQYTTTTFPLYEAT